jgi:hypothetical protein
MSCVHIIKLANQLSNMATLKIIILVKFQNPFLGFQPLKKQFSSNLLTPCESVFQRP